MSDGGRRPEREPSSRLRFESAAQKGETLGQVGSKSQRGTKYQQRFAVSDAPPPPITDTPGISPPVEDVSATSGQVGPMLDFDPKYQTAEKSDNRRLSFEDEPDAPPHPGTSGQVGPKLKNRIYRQHSEQARPSERLRRDKHDAPPGDDGPAPDDGADVGAAPHDAEKLNKSKLRTEKTGAKLDTARDKLSAQKPPKKPGPVGSIGRAARFQTWRYVHSKVTIYPE